MSNYVGERRKMPDSKERESASNVDIIRLEKMNGNWMKVFTALISAGIIASVSLLIKMDKTISVAVSEIVHVNKTLVNHANRLEELSNSAVRYKDVKQTERLLDLKIENIKAQINKNSTLIEEIRTKNQNK